MLIVEWKKWFLKIANVYYSDNNIEAIKTKADIIFFVQSPSLKKYRGVFSLHKKFRTLYIDLKNDENIIFNEMRKSIRKQIKRAMNQDQLQFNINFTPSEADIYNFSKFYNGFAKSKGIKKCNTSRMLDLSKKRALIISDVKDENMNILCSRTYIVTEQRAHGMYSASYFRDATNLEDRKKISRANCYSHWMVIKTFKEKGLAIYDFGGLSLDKDNTDLENITFFKQGFGGKELIEYNNYYGKSLLGKSAVFLLYFLWANNPELILSMI